MPKKRQKRTLNTTDAVREITSKENVIRGHVTEALANAHFRVEIPDTDSGNDEKKTRTVMAYLAGKMRLHRIRVIVGDTVELLMDEYGGKPRIVRRL